MMVLILNAGDTQVPLTHPLMCLWRQATAPCKQKAGTPGAHIQKVLFADASCLDDALVLGCTQMPVRRIPLI